MMKDVGFIIFCSVLLSSALAALDVTNSKTGEGIIGRRQKRSVIFFPAGSSDEEEEEDESAFFGFTINPFDNPLYGLIDKEAQVNNETNFHDESLSDTLRFLEEAMAEDVMERSLAGGGNPKNRRKEISIIGAAINALNPLTYMRGSFNGFRNALIQSIMPFKRRFGINRKDSKSSKVQTTESTTTIAPSTSAQPNLLHEHHQQSATNIASTSVSSPSNGVNQEKGLDLKIPPELVNYAALEVNLKPNGDINIVPITTRPTLNKKSNNPQQQNNGNNGSGFVNNNGGSGITGNRVSSSNFGSFSDSQESGSSFLTNNLNNNNNNNRNINNNNNINSNLGNNFGQTTNKIGGGLLSGNRIGSNLGQINNDILDIAKINQHVGLKNANAPNVVKLVTDRPVIVESIQDIIGADNVIRNNRINDLLSKSPVPVDFTNLFNDPTVDPDTQLRFPSNSEPSPDHIYLLPFRVNHNRNLFPTLQSPPFSNSPLSKNFNSHISKNDVDASEIYYIDITIPEKQSSSSRPIVSHKRYVSPKKYRRRTKRSETGTSNIEKDKEKTEGSGQFIDYDGWQPIDYTDPMSEQPTLVYKPPPFERVYFGEESPKGRPFYPVLPVNPPVYVIRAEPNNKEIHAVYGTENIDYLHVNPKTDSAKAYSAFGKNRFLIKNEINKSTPPKYEKSNSTAFSLSDILQNFVPRRVNLIAVNANIKKIEKVNSTLDNNNTNIISNNNTVNNNSAIVDNASLDDNSLNETFESQFSEKSLAVEDDYYYLYDDKQDESSNDDLKNSEDTLASESDPFASIIPKYTNTYRYKVKNTKASKTPSVDDGSDPYYAEASEQVERKQAPERASLHELLKNFGGVQFDRYIFSASENDEQPYVEEKPSKPSRSRQTLPLKPQVATGRKINPPKAESNTRDWYLIETRPTPAKSLDSIRKTKNFNNRNSFVDRQNSKYSESQNLYNPYSDNHIYPLKTAESLTANSLSELLQIFKYVTTPSPIQRLSDINSLQSKVRTFRYTKPTEAPGRTKHFTTFRYTVPFSKSVESTEPTVSEDVVGLHSPLKIINDSVAETNSLDGYLFSDSEAAAEYTKPEVRPNIIRINAKQVADLQTEKQKKKSMDEDAVQRGDIAPPLVIEVNKENDDQAYDSYLIHQGHSRVKIFGSNTNQGSNMDVTTQKSKSTTLDHIIMVPLSSVQYTVTLPPSTTTVSPKITKRQSRTVTVHANSPNENEFQERIDLNNQIIINKNISKWTEENNDENHGSFYAPSERLSNLKDQQNNYQTEQDNSNKGIYIPSPFRAFSELFMRYFPKSSRTINRRNSQSTSDAENQPLPTENFKSTRLNQKNKEDRHKEIVESAIPLPFEYFLELRSSRNDKSR